MPDADDNVLLALAPGIATPQVIEVRIKSALDGEYELSIGDPLVYDPIVHVANGATIEQIRDGMADQIVSPAYDPFIAWKVLADRFWVKGAPGDPFEFAMSSPSGATSATVKALAKAAGTPSITRATYLALAIKLIDPVVYRDVTQEAQAWLAAYFCEQYMKAVNGAAALSDGGQQANSMSLAVASVSFGSSMPTSAELEASVLYGGPLLLLMKARTYGPTWS
jgi:hypothetical protein